MLQILRIGFAHALEDAHGLMVQQADRHLPDGKRLHPFLAGIQLDDGDRAKQGPGHARG
ncbi:hypothetical protein D3C76_1736170 [compost metagenome]